VDLSDWELLKEAAVFIIVGMSIPNSFKDLHSSRYGLIPIKWESVDARAVPFATMVI
jgi:hypothetical protein